MSGYTPSGPFVSGNPPGLDSPFFNNIENWIQQFEGDAGSVSVNGQTSGTATLYQVVQATVKHVVVHLVNYRNSSAQTIALPAAFTDRAIVQVGETNASQIAFLSSGTAVNIKVFTSLSASGGTQTTQTNIAQWSFGQIDAAWDTLQLKTSGGSGGAYGVIIIEGF